MRVHFRTRKADDPFYFGFDFTPYFSTLSFEDPKVLFLSKGLRLVFRGGEAVVQGATNLEIPVKVDRRAFATEDERLAALVDVGEKSANAEVMAIQNPLAEMATMQPFVSVFRTQNRLISAEMVAEELLERMHILRRMALRKIRKLYGVSEDQLYSPRERCAYLNDIAQDGHLTPDSLNSLLMELKTIEPELPRAFFISNLDDYCESVRSAFLRSAYHASRMTFALHEVNKQKPVEFIVEDSELGEASPRELRHVSKLGDSVADEFASAALAAYSVLDLTRKLFDFIVREPFGEAKRSTQKHFMDRLPDTTPEYQVDLPMALPIVSRDQFKTLYLLRSDIIHNQGMDYLRPVIYWGVAQEPVNGQPLQYVQYMSRDVTPDGAASTHKWLPRFFSQKHDAEAFLGGQLTKVLECAVQTVEWLTIHLERTSDSSSAR